MGMPAEKSMNFWPSAKRLLGRLRPERVLVVAVILFGVVSVVLAVLGPKILGEATNIIFEGVDLDAAARGRHPGAGHRTARGQRADQQQADMLQRHDLHSG